MLTNLLQLPQATLGYCASYIRLLCGTEANAGLAVLGFPRPFEAKLSIAILQSNLKKQASKKSQLFLIADPGVIWATWRQRKNWARFSRSLDAYSNRSKPVQMFLSYSELLGGAKAKTLGWIHQAMLLGGPKPLRGPPPGTGSKSCAKRCNLPMTMPEREPTQNKASIQPSALAQAVPSETGGAIWGQLSVLCYSGWATLDCIELL